MKADQIALKLAPFKHMLNKNALSPLYSTLKLAPTRVTGCSAFAQMEVNMEIGVEADCLVNTFAFLTVIDSLNAKDEVVFAIAEGALMWKCGKAKGKLAQVALDVEMPRIKRKSNPEGAWNVHKKFGKALDLGAISCDNNGLASIGLYGIVIDNTADLCVYSSDSWSLSYCQVGDGTVDGVPDTVTLSPEAAAVLASVCKINDGYIHFGDDSLFYFSEAVRLFIRYSSPLSKAEPLSKAVDKLKLCNRPIDLPPGVISAFLKRVSVLAESQKQAIVHISLDKGRVSLSFASATNSADEYYIAEGLRKEAAIPPTPYTAGKIARALGQAEELLVDMLADKAIILRGKDPLFIYMLGAKDGE